MEPLAGWIHDWVSAATRDRLDRKKIKRISENTLYVGLCLIVNELFSPTKIGYALTLMIGSRTEPTVDPLVGPTVTPVIGRVRNPSI